MILPSSYACRETIFDSLTKLFASHPTIPFPSHVFLYGNSNTGKSTLVRCALETHRHSILWFDAREISSLNMFYQIFLDALPNRPTNSVKNFHDFLRILRFYSSNNKTTKSTRRHFFVVIHHIESLVKFDENGHFLYLLFKLKELTLGHFHHSLILIGHQPFHQLTSVNRIEMELGVLTPIEIFVPSYSRNEIGTILQLIFKDQQEILPTTSVSQMQILLELALQVFYSVTNDLIELRDMSTMCIRDFLRHRNENEENHDDFRLLYQKEFFMQILNKIYTRSMSIPTFLSTHTADEEKLNENFLQRQNKSNFLHRDLPISAKYLLITIYLATQNPIKYDRMLYDKQTQGKKSRRAKVMHKRSQLESAKIEYLPLSSNKPIGLNRLLAIFYALYGDTNPFTTQIYIQLALLTSMRLIEFVGGSTETSLINLNEPKYRCTSSSDYVRRLASSIDFKIDDLLLV